MGTTIENIVDQGTRYALIIREAKADAGTKFYTPQEAELQVAAFNLPAGYNFVPHIHLRAERHLDLTTEVLVIQEGRLLVQFYRENETVFCERVLDPGDVILLTEGGHGFCVLEPLRMLEIKQGPYMGERDKCKFAQPTRAG